MRIFQVDSFAKELFKGNPAAVLLLDKPASDEWMRDFAAEMNLSETAFVLREGDGFRLRWFTPTTEVSLCGHARAIVQRIGPPRCCAGLRAFCHPNAVVHAPAGGAGVLSARRPRRGPGGGDGRRPAGEGREAVAEGLDPGELDRLPGSEEIDRETRRGGDTESVCLRVSPSPRLPVSPSVTT